MSSKSENEEDDKKKEEERIACIRKFWPEYKTAKEQLKDFRQNISRKFEEIEHISEAEKPKKSKVTDKEVEIEIDKSENGTDV